jgi:DNA-binding NarL/FixJ family response regulator
MEDFHKTVAKTGDGITRINESKKILLIGGAKSVALLNGQDTYGLFHCDTLRQAWSLVYRHRPHLIVLNLGDSAAAGLSALQECRVLAGRVPIIVVAPPHLIRGFAAAMRDRAMAVIPATAMARSVGEVLQNVV